MSALAAASLLPPPVPLPSAARLPEGADAWAHALAGWLRRRPGHARRLRREAEACAQACAALAGCDDAALQQRLAGAREQLRRDPVHARGGLGEALAAVGETAYRVLGKRPYSVQFMGALAIHHGWLAEMATGEGKTLTAALAGVLAGWSGRPCHLVTANDYLAARDAEEMAPLYRACGLEVASVVAASTPGERAVRYAADVVYVTAKELLADHLRDQLAARTGRDPERLELRRWLGVAPATDAAAPGPELLLVRGLHTALVDEADNVLIDEAVTPLILSAPRPAPGLHAAVREMAALAATLQEGLDYVLLQRQRSVRLHEGAQQALEALAGRLEPLWRPAPRREELLRQALTVRHFIRREHHYVVQDGEVVLLDEATGRLTPGRTLTAGLHQAVQTHEGLEVTDPNESLEQMSFQSFFRRFRRLAGLTGTGKEAAAEFWRIYRLGVLPVPTHRPRQTRTAPARVLATEEAKWQAVVAEVQRVHAVGRPVLVGVRSVEASTRLAARLQAQGLAFELLNAVRHAEEARIVEHAGQPGRITIATNMAGRGTDIRLDAHVKSLGGLHVVVAEGNESPRTDRQLAGRCGRQGDPGSVAVFLSLEDRLALRFLGAGTRRALARPLCADAPGAQALAAGLLRQAQRRAEADAFERRCGVLKADDWLDSALPFERRGTA
ncbi:preprotein translocase subunit SecA [Azohydromonas australica]|uniref:preprotein translocase subunit SecA n=1 Tax=Azohydromonas australica TaxID=364039 RepID=UPI000411F9C3|nr:hypothetical protein [Azohydromonas australica]